ncbi:MAG: hypothetical protein FWD31_10920 [Planctomycetaceae bacterium]|nr:hypothetical protein [Planctomycetaceae bacterium]
MPEYDINSDNPLEMVWAIREKIYEETKHMTVEERMAHTSRQADEARRRMKEINPDDYDLSFLHAKSGIEK